MNAFLFGVWIGGSLGFFVGAWYACRPLSTVLNREPDDWCPQPLPRHIRRIARTPIMRKRGAEWQYIPADTVAYREDFDPSARAALDGLVAT